MIYLTIKKTNQVDILKMIACFKTTLTIEFFNRNPKENCFDKFVSFAPDSENFFTFFTPVNGARGGSYKLH
jgi:hypothetical protein